MTVRTGNALHRWAEEFAALSPSEREAWAKVKEDAELRDCARCIAEPWPFTWTAPSHRPARYGDCPGRSAVDLVRWPW